MKIDDVVTIITGCPDCGDVKAKILGIVDDRAAIEVIGELPRSAKERCLWIDLKRLRAADE